MTSTTHIAVEPSTGRQHALAVLLTDVEEAQRVAAALDDVRRSDGPLAVIAVPPVRGLGFFADAERQDKLDRWWAHAIPRESEPLYLLRHQDGVSDWLPGLDGHFIIGGATATTTAAYDGLDNVTLVPGAASLDIALAAVEHFAPGHVFRDDAAPRLRHRLGRATPTVKGRFRRARLRPADEVFVSGVPVSPEAHPIPNVPSTEPAAIPMGTGDAAVPPAVVQAGREELVRALADALHRLQEIRSAS